MPLADSSYPLLNIFWTMFGFFLWLVWISADRVPDLGMVPGEMPGIPSC